MRDAFLIFGKISAAAGATTAQFAPDVVRTTKEGKIGHVGNVHDITVAFSPVADFNAKDSLTPVIYHCETEGGTYTECARGMAVSAPTKDTVVTLQVPKVHYPYLKAGIIPTSTGTFSASAVEAWVGLGEADGSLTED